MAKDKGTKMDRRRIHQIARMVEVWNEAVQYDEDHAKTEVVEELMLEIGKHELDGTKVAEGPRNCGDAA